MKIAIGSDHRGLDARSIVREIAASLGHDVDDRGTHSSDPCDYPDIAADVARQVASRAAERGILLCGTGIGVAIAANKISGIRAAVCHDQRTAELSRRHNDANVLCVSADSADESALRSIVTTWLATPFDGGRHQRRVEKIAQLECRPIEALNG
jgi:ribose 5-phosphate isomerase B